MCSVCVPTPWLLIRQPERLTYSTGTAMTLSEVRPNYNRSKANEIP